VYDIYSFDEGFQLSVLALLVKNPKYATIYTEVIRPTFFTEKYAQDLCSIILDFFKKYSIVPTKESLREEIRMFTDNELLREYYDLYREVGDSLYEEVLDVNNAEYIASQIINFGRRAAIRENILRSLDYVDKCEFDKAQELIGKGFTLGVGSKDVGYDYFEKTEERCNKYKLPIEKGIPTGLAELDKYIDGGGVHDGWFSYVLAPTGIGKSTILLTITKNALLLGYKVLYITTEMYAEDLSKRLDSMFTGIGKKEFYNRNNELLEKLQSTRKIANKCQIHFCPRRTANTNTLRGIIERYKTRNNFIPDLIIVDYMDEMLPNVNHREDHIASSAIASELCGLGQELMIPIWSAAQASGTAWALQREKRNLEVDNTGGAKAKSHPADLIISLISIERDFENGTGVLQMGIIKSRHDAVGITILCDIDYKTLTITATSRQISADKKKKADGETKALLEFFQKQSVPEDEL
jgi:replicative DNA helicase